MTQGMTPPLLGAHLSIQGGYYKAIERAEALSCTALQVFTASNRQWSYTNCDPKEAEKFRTRLETSTVHNVTSHASYLINLASPKEETVKKSRKALIHEIQRCEQLHIPTVVLHPGSSIDGDHERAIASVAQELRNICDQTSHAVCIALEIMAGQGSNIGHTFEQLAALQEQTARPDRISICFDTCHAHAAGYRFDTKENYQALWNQIENTVGAHNVNVIHMNDSQHQCGSKKDRHEHIGYGHIPENAFTHIMNDPSLRNVPKLLETPKGEHMEWDKKNLTKLKNMIR